MNFKRIAVTGLVAGMVAITGCSSNLPETNQYNRNGQRVANSVNHRATTHRATGTHRARTENNYTNNGVIGRTTRGIGRVANDVANVAHNATHNTGTSHTNRHARRYGNSLNLGRPEGRMGNTFHYGNNTSYARGLHNSADGNAATISDQSVVNAGTTRNSVTNPDTVNRATANNTHRAMPARSAVTAANPTRNTRPETKKTETKPIDTKRSTTPKAKHESKQNAHGTHITHTAPTITHRAPTIRPVVRNVNRNINRDTTHRSQSGEIQNLARRSQARNTQTNTRLQANRTQNPNRYGLNLTTNRPEHRNTATTRTNNNYNTIGRIASMHMDQTIAVVNQDDNYNTSDEMAFFRKKVEEPTTDPTTPDIPETQELPGATSFNAGFDNMNISYDDSNSSFDDTANDITNDNDTDNTSNPNNVPTNIIPSRPARRAMK